MSFLLAFSRSSSLLLRETQARAPGLPLYLSTLLHRPPPILRRYSAPALRHAEGTGPRVGGARPCPLPSPTTTPQPPPSPSRWSRGLGTTPAVPKGISVTFRGVRTPRLQMVLSGHLTVGGTCPRPRSGQAPSREKPSSSLASLRGVWTPRLQMVRASTSNATCLGACPKERHHDDVSSVLPGEGRLHAVSHERRGSWSFSCVSSTFRSCTGPKWAPRERALRGPFLKGVAYAPAGRVDLPCARAHPERVHSGVDQLRNRRGTALHSRARQQAQDGVGSGRVRGRRADAAAEEKIDHEEEREGEEPRGRRPQGAWCERHGKE